MTNLIILLGSHTHISSLLPKDPTQLLGWKSFSLSFVLTAHHPRIQPLCRQVPMYPPAHRCCISYFPDFAHANPPAWNTIPHIKLLENPYFVGFCSNASSSVNSSHGAQRSMAALSIFIVWFVHIFHSPLAQAARLSATGRQGLCLLRCLWPSAWCLVHDTKICRY